MPTFKERFTDLLLGDERRKLQESAQLLYSAYLEGPFVLPPDQLLAQLKEQDAALLTDLVHQLYWEHLGTPGYTQDISAERTRAIDESRRLWKYNPLAQWMIWLWTNYGFGENIVIIPEDEDAIKTWEEFWKADRNQSVLAQDKIADKLSNWLLVDGDRFLAFYASTLDGEATIRRINTKEIVEVVTDPDDSSVPLFYKRQWSNTKNQQLTWYYPDWEAFFRGDLDRAELPRDAIRADEQNDNTVVCILHISFNGKDEDSLYGWPLLAAGSPWIRAQKRHLENRLSVSASKAMYARRAKVSGGSRAVNAVISNIQSALSSTQGYETNPAAVPGSTLVENQAVDTTDLPMTTGASDAKTDGEMFSWMAGLSGGVFPHYMGLGDAYRLATATSMEKPLEMQFSRYQVFWSAQFRKMVRIVLQMDEKYGGATYQTYEAEVSTDKMVEVDLDGMSQALGRVFTTIINPQVTLGKLPDEVTQGMLKASLKTILQALGVEAEAVLGDKVWKVEEEGELEESIALALQNYRSGLIDADDLVAFLVPVRLEEGGPGSGWFAPPRGTHGPGSQGGRVGLKTASQMRAELNRDYKRKMARAEQLKERADQIADQHRIFVKEHIKLFQEIEKAKAEGRTADVKRLEAERDDVFHQMEKRFDEMAKLDKERWRIRESINTGAYEKLKVANPADFTTDMGRLRKGREDLQQGSDAFADLIGRDTLNNETITMHTTTGRRGHYARDGVYLPPINRRRKVVVHELGHWLEDKDPDVHDKALAFLEERTKGETAISLREATGNPHYRANEMTKKDEFMHPYSGKQYSGGHATEIVSMGVEHMYSDPVGLAVEDPGHFDFIYNLMRGE